MIPRTPALARTPEAGRFLRRAGNLRVRRERRYRTICRTIFRSFVLAAVIGLSTWGSRTAVRWLRTTPHLAVTRIQVEGSRNADRQTLRSLASKALTRNLFALDLDLLARDVRAHPWVRDVVVLRRIPDTLVIRVRERKACALAILDGEAYLVDTEGAPIDRFGPRYPSWSFPVLRGLDDLDPGERRRRCRRAAVRLEELRRAWPALYGRLAEVDLSEPRFTVLSLEGGEERLRVDPDDWTRNLATYQALRTRLLQRHGRIRHVDLRWQGRLVALPEPANES